MKLRKTLAIVLSAFMLLGLMGGLMSTQAAEIADTMWVGDNVKATLYSDGTLVLSGSGPTWDFVFLGSASGDPDVWDSWEYLLDPDGEAYGYHFMLDGQEYNTFFLRGPIYTLAPYGREGTENNPYVTNVIIENGITYLGKGLLLDMYQTVKSVSIPDSVTDIHKNAFYNSIDFDDYDYDHNDRNYYAQYNQYDDFGRYRTITRGTSDYSYEIQEYLNTGYSGTIYASAGSVAKEYARIHEIPFVETQSGSSAGEGGLVQTTVNGINGWWYMVNGKVSYINTLAQYGNDWWCVHNGMIDFKYTGFEEYDGYYWYCENGHLNFYAEGLKFGIVNGIAGWWYVKDGAVNFTDTLVQCGDDWWFVHNGMIDFGYTGFAEYDGYYWYCENGHLNFYAEGLIFGTVNGTEGWWYVKNGAVDFTDTLAQLGTDWWCVHNGMVDHGYTGFEEYDGYYWYCENGYLNFYAEGLVFGTVNGSEGWWYVKNGAVNFIDTLVQYGDDWWCVRNGMVDFGYTGLVEYEGASWYCVNGRIKLDYAGGAA